MNNARLLFFKELIAWWVSQENTQFQQIVKNFKTPQFHLLHRNIKHNLRNSRDLEKKFLKHYVINK